MTTVDYEQVYDKAWEAEITARVDGRHAAGIAAVVAAAKADALVDAAIVAQQAFVDEQGGIGHARVRTDWLHERAATYRTPGGTDK